VDKRREIIGILLIMLGLFVLFSLVSYSPAEEPTISSSLSIDNWMGLFGVFTSYWLFKMGIGLGAYAISILLILWGIWIFGNKDYKILGRFSIYVIILALAASTAFALPQVAEEFNSTIGFEYSGLIGGEIAQFMYDWLNLIGSIIFLTVILLIVIRGYFGWSFYGPITKVKHWLVARKFSFGQDEEEKDLEFNRSGAKQKSTSNKNDSPSKKKARKTKQSKNKRTKSTSSTQNTQTTKSKNKKDTKKTANKSNVKGKYNFPPVDILKATAGEGIGRPSDEKVEENSQKLEDTLETFNVHGKVRKVVKGPIISRYEIEPESGVRVNRITNLENDLARILEAESIRIVAPIPGKSVVGIEIPNEERDIIRFRDIVASKEFRQSESILTLALGTDTTGQVQTVDLAELPHLLIAGATGSGKSVSINMMVASILYRASPEEVKFVMIDPKKLELSLYEKIADHYLIKNDEIEEEVITEPDNAILALRSLKIEMDDRYERLSQASVRHIDQYNQKVRQGFIEGDILPKIVVVIDELADLMMSSAKEVEPPIAKLAQKARAVGIHLIVATQRPSVDVVTGLIKANFPARIAFKVTSKVDSRTILDNNGAESLLGNGDLLITTPKNPELRRMHSAYISLEELEDIMDFIEGQPVPEDTELPSIQEQKQTERVDGAKERDELFNQAMELVITHQQGSASMLQRRLKIGYARASRIIDQLQDEGIVGPHKGSKARDVLVDESYLYGSDDVTKNVDED